VAEKPKGFGTNDVRRIGQVVRYVENLPRSSGAMPGQPFAAAYTSGRWVRLTASSVAARSGASCSSGAITFQNVSDGGVFSDTSETATGWNGTTKAMTGGSGRYYWAAWSNGKWWLWPSACADLT
jgi:hypothetical protein